MSLQLRLVLLLALLGATVAINFALAVWSIQFLESEIRRPLASVQQVMSRLASAKRAFGAQHNILAPLESAIGPGATRSPTTAGDELELPDPRLDPRERFTLLESHVRQRLTELEATDALFARPGLAGPRSIRARAEVVFADAHAWFESRDGTSPDEDARKRASMGLFNLHELIEWLEGRIIEDVGMTAAFGADLRSRIFLMFGIGLLAMALTGWLAVGLVRRWVVVPVRELQAAAVRFAGGDLAYRVSIAGGGELADLGREFNDMAATIARMHAERIERERLAAIGEVVRRIVHNLRNPLAGIRSLAELTRGDLPPTSDLRENQDRIISSVDRFESWLKEILSITRPLELRIERQPVADWLRSTASALRATAESMGITLRVNVDGAPAEAEFDSRHLEQAVVALITNAIQATPRGGEVTITAEASENVWRIKVSDSGPGIPAELLDKIFRPYFTTKRDGSGIGLAMVKQTIEGHQDRIEVIPSRSDGPGPGSGAVFVLHMPLTSASANGQSPPAGASIGHNPDHRG